MKINSCQGDLTNILAETKSLLCGALYSSSLCKTCLCSSYFVFYIEKKHFLGILIQNSFSIFSFSTSVELMKVNSFQGYLINILAKTKSMLCSTCLCSTSPYRTYLCSSDFVFYIKADNVHDALVLVSRYIVTRQYSRDLQAPFCFCGFPSPMFNFLVGYHPQFQPN